MGIPLNTNNRQSAGSFLHYYLNYSSSEAKATYSGEPGTNILDAKAVAKGAVLTLAPWDMAIVEETTPTKP